MNCNDFRSSFETIEALNDDTLEVLQTAHIDSCSECRQWLENASVSDAVGNLESQLALSDIPRSAGDTGDLRRRSSTRSLLKVAAGVGLAAGIGGICGNLALNERKAQQFADRALHQFQLELPMILDAQNENVAISEVNARLPNVFESLQHLNDPIRLAEFCNIDQIRAAHVVIDGSRGPVSFYVTRSPLGLGEHYFEFGEITMLLISQTQFSMSIFGVGGEEVREYRDHFQPTTS